MDLDDEYHLALKRWTSAIVIWANHNLPASGYEFNRLNKLDQTLQEVTDRYIKENKDEKN